MKKQFHELLEELRIQKQISKKDLAQRANVTPGYISLLSRGERSAPSKATVTELANALDLSGETRLLFFEAAGYTPSTSLEFNLSDVLQIGNILKDHIVKEDWRTAPTTYNFWGRVKELQQLEPYISENKYKVIAILGLGGIGKTSLAAKLATNIKNTFEYAFWRSLLDAPPLRKVLEECIRFLSDQQPLDIPEDEDSWLPFLIDRLLELLSEHRCLIVLDNFETTMQSGERAGEYRDKYEGYGKLLQRLGETDHQSCIIITSREKPREMVRLEGANASATSMALDGLNYQEVKQILQDRQLVGETKDWVELIEFYRGNPLALKLIAEPIQQLFGGDIALFLSGNDTISGDIQGILEEQFLRLSEVERSIMYWIAIKREAISRNELKSNLILGINSNRVTDAISSLGRRSLIEIGERTDFTLQPVIMEYVTDHLVEQICQELRSQKLEIFLTHALLLAQTKDYLRETQRLLILTPIIHWLKTQLGQSESEKLLKELLTTIPDTINYAAGNIINLLIQSGADLRGADFSRLTIRQAFLQGVALPQVNFSDANLADSVFTDTIGSILTLTMSPDGKLMAAGTDNGDIRLWENENSRPFQDLLGHTDWVNAIAFSPDGKLLASGSDDQTVRIWEVDTGVCIQKIPYPSLVYTIAFSPDGELVATGGDDGILWLRDLTTGKISELTGHTEWIRSIAFSPDGRFLASGSADKTIRIWEIETEKCSILQGHTGWVYAIAFSPDGKLLASGSADHTILIWEVASGNRLKTLRGHTNWVRSIAFSVNGIIASGSTDQTIMLWQADTGQHLRTLSGHTGRVWSVTFSVDGQTVISGSDDQTVRLWDVHSGNSLKTLQGHTDWIRSVTFSPDGKLLASGGADQLVHLWSLRSQIDIPITNFHGHQHWIWSVAFSPDGNTLASGSDDTSVRLWDVQADTEIKMLRGHNSWVGSVAFSPDGALLASGSQDQTVKLWDVYLKQELKTLLGHTHWVGSVAFSPDGTWLASGSDDTDIRVWDITTGTCLHTLTGHEKGVSSVTIHPDGILLASGSQDQTIKLWDAHTGTELRTLRGHGDKIFSIAFSPDGKLLASGGADLTIRIWNVADGSCIRTLKGHTHWIYSVAFRPDGEILASSGHEGIIKLWNIQNGRCLRNLRNERPYEGMNITRARGLTDAQKTALKLLGAIETR
ncbi:NB-ARC domain-containing protein [Dictyobacter kobayashii]|uniref:HTH cro/C1-type domain-containing protein n=1 Tax=Dictyobacter kobayashii TaxID=2014872 RepID=A0A402AI38_9CHLR|nr:NB-ARC domain-containing protein [Dictyobacter kobayashii]GCE18788.1 hypothetical protein KDK_25880 [Dictyobacter kobayashii]